MPETPQFTDAQKAAAALALAESYAKAGKQMPSMEHRLLEQKGWQDWLMTLFPFWFSETFSKEHIQYWDLHWKISHQIKNKDVPT